MSLLKQIQDVMSDDKTFGSDKEPLMVKTGFDVFDYLNGKITIDDSGKEHLHVGVDSGKLITVIGKSGSGKSTFAMQMAYNIIKPYDEGAIVFLDYEGSNEPDRLRMVTGMSEEEYQRRVTMKKVGIYTETVLQAAAALKKLKLENKKTLLVDNAEGYTDSDGKVKKVLPPSVIIVDSIAMLIPKKSMETEEMAGGMDATAMAKANTQLFKRLVQICLEANIIVIFINHINAKISTGPMPTQSSINYLKQDETLPQKFLVN